MVVLPTPSQGMLARCAGRRPVSVFVCLLFTRSECLEGNANTLNIVNASYLFTQFSTIAKIYTTTAREPSIYIYIYIHEAFEMKKFEKKKKGIDSKRDVD